MTDNPLAPDEMREALAQARSFVLTTTVPYAWPDREAKRVRVLAQCDAALATPSQEQQLREALGQWKCGSCGGSGMYTNKGWRDTVFTSEIVPCKTCGGRGLNPIAYSALNTHAMSGESA